MNAQELTERYYADHQRINELEKQVEFLAQKIDKLRLLLNDMKIDVIMLQDRK